MTKEERRKRFWYNVDEISMLVMVMFLAILGSVLESSKRHHRFSIDPLSALQSVVIAVGGYGAVQVRFSLNRGRAKYWKRLYAGLNAAFGGDFWSVLTHG